MHLSLEGAEKSEWKRRGMREDRHRITDKRKFKELEQVWDNFLRVKKNVNWWQLEKFGEI